MKNTIDLTEKEAAQLQQKENRKNALLMVGGIVLLLLFIYAVAKSGKATNTMSLPDVLPLIEGL